MKTLISNYTFDASAQTIAFNDYTEILLERILLIVNVTDNIIIYNFADPLKGGSVVGNDLTLTYDTSLMSDTDDILIYYDDGDVAQLVENPEYATRLSTSGSVTYVGKAAIGSATSSAVWQIKKIDESSGTVITWADGNSSFDNIWDNRASLTYS
jgi:hypothetical protein